MRRKTLVVMVKVPNLGRVKTRLGRDMGMVDATWWFRHQVARLLRNVSDPRWDVVLSVSPDVSGVFSRVWPYSYPRMAQGRGDLGQRMARVFRDLPHGPVVLIGGDIPNVGRGHIADAFAQIGANGTVFGPATDGGYWLVGFKRVKPLPKAIFKDVRWSTEHALADTLATLDGQSVGYAQTMQDVDTLKDLQKITLST